MVFFRAVMLNITKSNIWAIQGKNSFAKTLELEILVFSTEFWYSVGVSSNLFYKLGNSRKLRKLVYKEEQNYKSENNYDREFLQK